MTCSLQYNTDITYGRKFVVFVVFPYPIWHEQSFLPGSRTPCPRLPLRRTATVTAPSPPSRPFTPPPLRLLCFLFPLLYSRSAVSPPLSPTSATRLGSSCFIYKRIGGHEQNHQIKRNDVYKRGIPAFQQTPRPPHSPIQAPQDRKSSNTSLAIGAISRTKKL